MCFYSLRHHVFPSFVAFVSRRDDVCMMLIGAEAEHWARLARAQDKYSALIYASWNGRTECVRLLLDAGADKEAKDEVRASRSSVPALGRLCDCNEVDEKCNFDGKNDMHFDQKQ